MRFKRPLLQLPVRFCADSLAAEVNALPSSAWVPHPQGFVGNEAVPLVSPNGELTDSMKGPMAATEHLRRCPYIMALMAELGGVWGRSRLMGLAPRSEVPSHIDIHYYWRTHIRIHIPVITNPSVRFTCGSDSVHMASGECWIFDSFQLHNVQNDSDERRIHLVIDTVGGERLWDLIEAAGRDVAPPDTPWTPQAGAAANPPLAFESINLPDVMSSWELRCHLNYLIEHTSPNPLLEPVIVRLERFAAAWGAAWFRFGSSDEGLSTYRSLIVEVRRDLAAMAGRKVTLTNGAPLYRGLEAMIFSRAVTADDAETHNTDPDTSRREHVTS
jgi:hypothetical protein